MLSVNILPIIMVHGVEMSLDSVSLCVLKNPVTTDNND